MELLQLNDNMNTLTMTTLASRLVPDLTKIEELLGSLEGIENETDAENIKTIIYIKIQEIEPLLDYWLNYLKNVEIFKIEKKTSVQQKIAELEGALGEKKEELQILNWEIKRKDEEIEALKTQVEILSGSEDVVERAHELLDMIEQNKESLALSSNMKEHKDIRGENSPAFKKEARTDEIVNDYKEAGYKITHEMIEKYKMTLQGLKYRLQTAGVYMGRAQKKGAQK